jgi:UDP-N-acetylglucosamine transferase subunit ALG13
VSDHGASEHEPPSRVFLTVGTHEDPFDRVVAELDRLVGSGEITGAARVQTGYSTVTPLHCRHDRMLGFDQMQAAMREAEVVVTHGGPASIMQALALGRIPVVVPRQSRFGEHVDDHQCRFAARIADRVLVVLDIGELGPAIREHAARTAALPGGAGGPERARAFAQRLDALCRDLLGPHP